MGPKDNSQNKNRLELHNNKDAKPEENKDEVKKEAPLIFNIVCSCGNYFRVQNPSGWRFQIVGVAQWRCPCGAVINTPAMWQSASK